MNPFPGDFTLECAIRPDAIAEGFILSTRNSLNSVAGGWLEMTAAGRIAFQIGSGSYTGAINGSTVLVAGRRYHLCVTRAAGVCTLYLNGRVDDVKTIAASMNAQPLTVGNNPRNAFDLHFPGVIEHARVWTRGLTADEVAQLAIDN